MEAREETRWRVVRRRYFKEWVEGIAEKVVAERRDHVAWTRVLEAVFWWPQTEGKEWPAIVVPGPEWLGVGPEPDTWAHFEAAVGFDATYSFDELGEDETLL
jgi:hypothetical protein